MRCVFRSAPLLIVAVLSACSTAPAIFDSKDTARPTGDVKPLASLLQGATRVRAIFLHGVGDHCPGYAFPQGEGDDSKMQFAANAWLDEQARSVIGLQPRDGNHTIWGRVFPSAFMPEHSADGERNVVYRVRSYNWIPKPSAKPIEFQAIEITWAPLTKKIKTNLLAYDARSVFTDEAAKQDGCLSDPDSHALDAMTPPSRAYVNKLVKESVLDRALADAVIYTGSYRTVIEHGVIDALCHAIAGFPSGSTCGWPSEPMPDEKTTRYLFFTHSLGSRIMYDLFFDTLVRNNPSNPFAPAERAKNAGFVASVLANTASFYMMANQLPMLGLANVTNQDANDFKPFGNDPLDTYQSGVIKDLAKLRAAAARARHVEDYLPELNITAFHDTNDLLSWPLPKWYGYDHTENEADTQSRVHFTNVVVENTTPWLWLYADPLKAHANYFNFRDNDVWNVISCGGSDGHMDKCKGQ